jgi:hypothetical protein
VLPTVGRWVAALSLAGLACAVLAGWATPTEAGVAGIMLLAAALLVAMRSRQMWFLARSVSRFEIFGASVEFARALDKAQVAAGETATEESGRGADQDVDPDDLLTLRLSLERKLAYIANELLAVECGDHHHASYVTVGSLKNDNLLTDAQAQTLSRLLTMSDQDLARQEARAVHAFLRDAGRVVANLRANVFRRLVVQDLRARGWRRAQGEVPLPALASRWERNGRDILVRPVLDIRGTKVRAEATARALTRWQGQAAQRLVVVPDGSTAQITDAAADPAVLALRDFRRAVA